MMPGRESPNLLSSVIDSNDACKEELTTAVKLGAAGEVVLPVVGPTLTRQPTWDMEPSAVSPQITRGSRHKETVGEESAWRRFVRFLWDLVTRCCRQLLGRRPSGLGVGDADEIPCRHAVDQQTASREFSQQTAEVQEISWQLHRVLQRSGGGEQMSLLDCCRLIQHWRAVFTDIADSEHVSGHRHSWNVMFESWNTCMSPQVRTLGEGAGGVVKVHRWLLNGGTRPHSLVAVKQFRSRRHNESTMHHLSAVLREFTIGAALKHPNIIDTRLLVVSDSAHQRAPTFNMVQEYPPAPCHDLFHIVQRCHYTREEAVCWFKQLLRGVEWMHRVGVAHRDLKPENILIDYHGQLRIIDFGLATLLSMAAGQHRLHGCHLHGERKHWKDCEHGSDAGEKNESVTIPCHGLCGSLPYIPPEEFSEFEYDAAKVDVWMAAVVFLVVVYHAFPWQAATTSDPYYRHYANCLKSMRSTPAASEKDFYLFARLKDIRCAELLQKMLHTDPKQRITSASVLNDPWMNAAVVCLDAGDDKMPHQHPCCSNPQY